MLKSMELQVNGTNHNLQVEPERSPLSVLRDELDRPLIVWPDE
jgi:aerobic-type carbon monoxide dehydrogenase small subunit (CoxS/CutS family)